MKIAIATRFAHSVGGVETYLECVVPALMSRGHEVTLWHEIDLPAGTRSLVSGAVTRHRLGPTEDIAREAIGEMRRWKPDVVFSQGIARTSVELELTGVAPFVTALHAYQGTCISGFKTHSFPVPVPCQQPLGPSCLLQFHVRRCGGWSPVTMVRDYTVQVARRDVLRCSAKVVTLSKYMRAECARQGVADDRVHCVPGFAPALPEAVEDGAGSSSHTRPLHLAFAGRMERLKGALLMLEALRQLAPNLLGAIRVTMVGDGTERADCERLAATLRQTGGVIEFPGWLSREEWSRVLRRVDLLVVPSVWPEPFGLIGLEAATVGVPALAFDVGGISDWLVDGETGRLLQTRPAAEALARGIEDCLGDPAQLQRWGRAAAAASSTRTADAHAAGLEAVLQEAVDQRAFLSARHPS